ncbi:MAG TPA: lipid-binding SYLF domain-containing protein [Vicinamibacterales bacterium]|nr:lipid-binding SYLF domain-containing protein [Vicinamibacterales bacterium]
MVIGTVAFALVGSVIVGAQVSRDQENRIRDSAAVLMEIHGEPDKDVPQDLWNKATCVIVIPSLKKAAFIFGGEYGKGMMSCRHDAAWSAPVFMELEKGSWGFQIGAESIDLVLLVRNPRGMEKLLSDKVSLGADVSVAAGPVGRTGEAATDAQLSAEIVSYSRVQGLFAGIDLSGGVLKADEDANRDLYGRKIAVREVLNDGTQAPASTQAFLAALRREQPSGRR